MYVCYNKGELDDPSGPLDNFIAEENPGEVKTKPTDKTIKDSPTGQQYIKGKTVSKVRRQTQGEQSNLAKAPKGNLLNSQSQTQGKYWSNLQCSGTLRTKTKDDLEKSEVRRRE